MAANDTLNAQVAMSSEMPEILDVVTVAERVDWTVVVACARCVGECKVF